MFERSALCAWRQGVGRFAEIRYCVCEGEKQSGETMRLHIVAFTVVLTARSLSAQAPPVPAEYQDLYDTLARQIAGFDAAANAGWNGSSYPYLDAPQLEAASSDQYTTLLGTNSYTYSVIPQLEELQAPGANAVTVHLDFLIFYQPFYAYMGNPAQYQPFVNFCQQFAQNIRARGMRLAVEASLGMPLVGDQVFQFQSYLDTLSWSEYIGRTRGQRLGCGAAD